ncbi:heavy metal-associated isoprenylated plant protein 43-like [Sesamum indicum]|uniref:Heavy metal-associated isoprenylated plant protein 43-like n=1 Tax=Sesamum indicum TaxID=4182 RepID=A0A6I9UKK7_SESIN|nr:heavy metal-associated isoprenylated plant protein 43-like [Sesamum indicum]
MVQKTVLKVDISCEKCKKKILKAVSGIPGVDKVEIDGAKGTLSVTGDADPYEIIVKTRKAGKFGQVVSIGPPPPPPQKQDVQEKKKPEAKKPQEKKDQAHDTHTPFTANPIYDRIPVIPMTRWEEPNPHCSIL